ncbi:unnamed protein product [marine sediment metagenome]|uniref:Uncharacterized protein n=1 Tax=marine sediment metagenome TaxID=412755 RepID=X1G5P9_9ZZZZ
MVSFDMAFEERNSDVIPKGLYAGVGIDGFIAAYKEAAKASSKLNIVYIDQPLHVAVQVIDENYDEPSLRNDRHHEARYKRHREDRPLLLQRCA